MNTQNDASPILSPSHHCIAFDGLQRIAAGSLAEVAVEIKRLVDSGRHRSVLIFDAVSSELMEVDTRGSVEDVALRYAGVEPSEGVGEAAPPDAEPSGAPRPRGRPKLGVVAREVTLLPRHWEWLGSQPGGASVALRKLVEDARRAYAGRDMARKSREAAYRFMSAIASGLDSFEEVTRALFAGDRLRFEDLMAAWPADVREHALALAQDSFTAG